MSASRNNNKKNKDEKQKKKRKNPYIPGLAALNFKPTIDWDYEKAKNLYVKSKHPLNVDNIIYSDCIQGMKTLPSESVDLIIADPPFGINFSGKENFYNRKSEYVTNGYKEISENYEEFTKAWMTELPRLMKKEASAYIFSGWTNLKDILNSVENSGLRLINHIIWKYQFGVFTKRKFVSSHYHILFLVKDPKRYFFNKIEHYPEDVWIIPRKYNPAEQKNSTKLPFDLVSRCINFSSKPGDLIFDPFMGNASTAICAKVNFRHYYGYEINSDMKEIIDYNVNNTEIGQDYSPHINRLPSKEELVKKYPSLKKHLLDSKKPNREIKNEN